MSEYGGRPIRGCRPSRRGLAEEDSDEAELVRLANIELYAKRASAGLPIFDDHSGSTGSSGSRKGSK